MHDDRRHEKERLRLQSSVPLEVRSSGRKTVPARGVPVVAQQIGEAVGAGGRQRVSRRILSVDPQRGFGAAPPLVVERREPTLQPAAQRCTELVLELDPRADDGLVPAGPGRTRRGLL